MRPDARVQAAIDVLAQWLATDQPAERVFADWGRANRYAGSGDRRAIADLVYDAIRKKRSAAWLSGSEDARGLILGSLIDIGADVEALFSGNRHGPEALSQLERNAVVLPPPLAEAPWGVRLDLPDWVAPDCEGLDQGNLNLLRSRAPLDLRVNRLKTDPETAIAQLIEDQITVEPGPLAPDCLRVTSGAHRVQRSQAYLGGLVEIQDAASQAGAVFSRVKPGEDVLDFCAGGGGKTLALAAMQQGRGRLEAYDISAARLAQIPARADRAGAQVTLLTEADLTTRAGGFDVVFLDAPCSGSGAWRRTPEAKWNLSPARLDELVQLQHRIILRAAEFLRPKGRLIYATCSLFRRENNGQTLTTDHEKNKLVRRLCQSWTDLQLGDGFYAVELALK
ncbi:MAG: RsmB/NOP family class I SAM-dependent RNA methyltransferase [Pseudomonadota bacterium]